MAVAAIVGAALVASAPIATADPVNDAYLAQLRSAGLTWPPGHDGAMIGMALDPRGIAVGDVASMVGIAHATYCPNQKCWAPHC
jgi:hypothetical protein